MDTKKLRQKILDLAIRGKLVPQDPNDEPASVLLEKIREEKKQLVKEGKLKAKDIKNDTIIFKGEDNLHYEKFQDGHTWLFLFLRYFDRILLLFLDDNIHTLHNKNGFAF